MRFQIWRARHNAKVLSKHCPMLVNAYVETVKVGVFQRGKEVGK